MAIQIGDVAGDYQVTDPGPRGGMGKVFRMRNLLTDHRPCASVPVAGWSAAKQTADFSR
jgi:hypothetical protein